LTANRAVFLSYAREDTAAGGRVAEALLNHPKNNAPLF
jgi:hypothetical protein